MKSLFGVKHLLHDRWGVVESPLLAYRLPTMCLAGLGLFLVFLLGRRLGGLWAGFIAQIVCMSLPRMYFHSHLACFDLPVTVLWLAITYSFLRARYSPKWVVPSGILLGLGFATKLNVFFLPFLLLGVAVLEVIVVHRSDRVARGDLIRRYAWIGASFIVVGGIVFFVHGPLLYPMQSLVRRYVQFPRVTYIAVDCYDTGIDLFILSVCHDLGFGPLVSLVLCGVGLGPAFTRLRHCFSGAWTPQQMVEDWLS